MKNIQDIIKNAEECLNCKNPLCKKGCPIETNIPEFIKEIKNNNFDEAYKILQKNNIMSDICSNVCPYEEYCTGHCVKGIKGNPVQISKLEKAVNLWARENNIEYKSEILQSNNINIAIIGAGPAGIECRSRTYKNGL